MDKSAHSRDDFALYFCHVTGQNRTTLVDNMDDLLWSVISLGAEHIIARPKEQNYERYR